MSGRETHANLRERLSRLYHLERKELMLGDTSLSLFAVGNIDDLMDALLAKGEEHPDVRDERLPYWAELWPSALAMARHILETQNWETHPSVLEIGCGLGLPSIAAALSGAEVILSDYLPEPLELARLNWLENFRTEPDCRILDWRQPDPGLAADILLASDVAYEARAFAPLLQAFRSLLRPGGRILLSEPNRTFAKPFMDSLPAEGFQVETFTYPVSLNGMEYKVSVREIQALR